MNLIVVGKEESKYKINVLSKSDKSILEIEVNIKNLPNDERNGDGDGDGDGDTNVLAIVLPIVFGIIFIVVIIIICVLRKKRQLTSEDVTKELISVGLKDSELKETVE